MPTPRTQAKWIPRTLLAVIGWALVAVASQTLVLGAETTEPATMGKTLVVLTLDSADSLSIRTWFREQPPIITVQFPAQRVIGSLPERSAIAAGAIREILTTYDVTPSPRSKRFISSVQVVLSAPYAYRIRTEPSRVIVEIDHPASVTSASVEVGLKRGTILGALGQPSVSERFRAMQEALAHATPIPWTLHMTAEPNVETPITVSGGRRPGPAPSRPRESAPRAVAARPSLRSSAISTSQPAAPRAPQTVPSAWWALAITFTAVAGLSWWLLRTRHPEWPRIAARGSSGRMPSGVVLIDQLMWRAFERQGYQLVGQQELSQPISGTFRVVAKDGIKSALLFAGNGPFFEKQTVERFIRLMRDGGLEQGVLVASGSFTVPAQRFAKSHHVTLIGREQLPELLSAGASSEYFAKQLEQQHAKLEEAKETLRQYANELDTLRRQRNEASWFLGEEREKSAKLETDLAETSQQLHRHETALSQWEQEAATLRKQWEESQWYLGESQARVRHLEEQLVALQEAAQQAERAGQERDEANWYLAEERAKREALDAALTQLQQHLDGSRERELELQRALARLEAELSALRTHWGERRARTRVRIPHATIELYDGQESPIFSGTPRDFSSTGVGLDTDQELPSAESFRMRLCFPGNEPIESQAQLVWQLAQVDGESQRYQSGCRLVDLDPSTRIHIEELIQQSQPLPT